MFCRFLWIVLCVVGYLDCFMCCRLSCVPGVGYPVDCVMCCRFPWIVFCVVGFRGLCYVL